MAQSVGKFVVAVKLSHVTEMMVLAESAYLVGMVTIVSNSAHHHVPTRSVTKTLDIVLNHVPLVSMETCVMKSVARSVCGAVIQTVENVLHVLCTNMVIYVSKTVAPTVKQLTALAVYAIETVATVHVDAKIKRLEILATATAHQIVSSVIILIPVLPVNLITGGNSVKHHVPLIV